MSQENVDVVRQAYESWSTKRALDLDLVDPAIEWSTATVLDGGVVLHGRDGVREWFRQLESVWEDVWWDIERIEDLGDRVLVISQATARGRGSGVPVTMTIGTIWTLKEGKIFRVQTYMDPAEARAAAGLEE